MEIWAEFIYIYNLSWNWSPINTWFYGVLSHTIILHSLVTFLLLRISLIMFLLLFISLVTSSCYLPLLLHFSSFISVVTIPAIYYPPVPFLSLTYLSVSLRLSCYVFLSLHFSSSVSVSLHLSCYLYLSLNFSSYLSASVMFLGSFICVIVDSQASNSRWNTFS
jgi:hypothetical protein